jgi:hypothetical protein
MQQILFVAATNWFCVATRHIPFATADTADQKSRRLKSPALTSSVSV